MSGARKVLADRGFRARDLVLKKWETSRRGIAFLGYGVLTYDEDALEEVERSLPPLEAAIKRRDEEVRKLHAEEKLWTGPLADLNKRFALVEADGELLLVERAKLPLVYKAAGRKLPTSDLSAEDRDRFRDRFLDGQVRPLLAMQELGLIRLRADRDALLEKQKRVQDVEDLPEKQRLTDVKEKMLRELADCDLLVVPRVTFINLARDEVLPNRLHGLSLGQQEAIKDFLKAGKPVLFCLGPPDEPDAPVPPPGLEPDRLEQILAELGLELPPQTILFNKELPTFVKQAGSLKLYQPPKGDVPPVAFAWLSPAARANALAEPILKQLPPPNPLQVSLRMASRAVGKSQPPDLTLRQPRPVYYRPPPRREHLLARGLAAHGLVPTAAAAPLLPGAAAALAVAGMDPSALPDWRQPGATFLMTDPDAFNTDDPFAVEKSIGSPEGEANKKDKDLKKDTDLGTVREPRQGQFPVGVIVETTLPESWSPDKNAPPRKVRLAVIGHGGVFTGESLSPTRQKLLVDVTNWLLGRDDLLARDYKTWQYPRVELDAAQSGLWQWGTRLGLPLLFCCLGLMCYFVRQMR
jgi:hypothetical protein